MNSINDEEDEDDDDDDDDDEMTMVSVDQFPSVRPPSEFSHHSSRNNNIYSSKQTIDSGQIARSKSLLTNRSTSLPSRQTFSSNLNNRPRRRRNASDSQNNNKALTTSLVTSFIQYLRSELRATTNDRKRCHSPILKKKSIEKINYLAQTFNLSNNFYRQQYPIRMNTPSSSITELSLTRLSNENLLNNDDEDEILNLINLLILRVECQTNENSSISKPTIKQVDQNLIEYLYYLFNKFVRDEPDFNRTMIDKNNFVHVCQTLVRNGCFNIPPSTSPDQSISEGTITNTNERTFAHEYPSETEQMLLEKSSCNDEQDIWLVVDFEPKFSASTPDRSRCLLPSSTSDEPFFFPNENYFSLDEIKSSCDSESSQSNYYSPDSSLVDIQNMVQEFDEINNNNNNNNTVFIEDGSVTIDQATSNHPNVIIEAPDTTNRNKICTGLTDEHVVCSTMESTEDVPIKLQEKSARRERKMQERWTMSTRMEMNNNEHLPVKTFLGVDFPPIAVLRKKFSTLPITNSSSPPLSPPILNPVSSKTKSLLKQIESKNTTTTTTTSISSSTDQEIINFDVNQTKHVQVLDRQSTDTSSLNDIQSSLTITSELLTDEKNVHEDMNMNIEPEHMSSPPIQINMDTEICNSPPSLSASPSSSSTSSSTLLSVISSSSPPSSRVNTNEKKTIEFLLKEIEEEEGEKKEEEHGDDNDHVDTKKKNKSNVEHVDHASGTILINSEPTQVVFIEQEKEETERSCNYSQPEDELSIPNLSNHLIEITMIAIHPNEQRYKTIEIEEISDEDDDDLSIFNNPFIEPTDCILTDDELKLSPAAAPPPQSTTKHPTNTNLKFDTVLSCYEKALSKTVETIDDSIQPPNVSQIPLSPKRSQRPEDDPIALRALQRFEERMNAAAAKTSNEESSPFTLKGKSSWSGTLSAPRKSIENLFKPNHQSLSTSSTSQSEELSPTHDAFIRPRKTMLDDNGLHFGMTLNLFPAVPSNPTANDDTHQKLEEQHPPTAIGEDDDDDDDDNNKQNEPSTTNMIESDDSQQPINNNSSITNESSCSNETNNSNSLLGPSFDQSSADSLSNTVISHLSTEQQSLTPYRLQLEGRRRLNTLERIRERHVNQESNGVPQQLQFQNEYTLKAEDLQDPIIRRALERFDEKSRSLAQAKAPTYDDIQDPITRRALMRFETNLKRTNPPSTTNIDPDSSWFTNSYTLGSLQSNPDHRFVRSPDSTLPPTSNHKPPHISVHQRFASTSSADMSEVSPSNIPTNNDPIIPIMRLPTHPVYVTTNNQPSISFRQRSRLEDMLSSRDLSISQTANLDEHETVDLQRHHSSEDLQEETFISNETDPALSNTTIKTLDPNFVRSAETSLNYAIPSQSYTADSCEYTRPHRNQPEELPPSRNLPQENEIQSSSAFLPVHPPTNTYYPQAPSYPSMYAPNNLQQTPYSDDPIIRRALERFNCQMQNSLMGANQQQPNMNYMPRQMPNGYPPRQGNFEAFHPPDLSQHEGWINGNRPMPPSSNTATGYQSIIGRRRQLRHDDIYHDSTSIGNGYSSSLFINAQNSHPYMNFPDEPPAIPPRLHRDIYHEQPEYLSENMNNNNNNHAFVHHPYPGGIINGFHPVHHQYIPPEYFQQMPGEDFLRHRAQSTSSNTSSDSINPIRLMQQRLPPTFARTNLPQNKNILPDQMQILSEQITPSNGIVTGDSIFHRLAYTATKASLSKSSSNLCANLLAKTSQQQQQQQQQDLNKLKTQEIDYEDSTAINDQNVDSTSTPTNPSSKCQRSRSVDGRARIKNAQNRANNAARTTTNYDDGNPSTTVPSSKFTSINPRRDAPPPRAPIIPRTTIVDRTSSAKRLPNGNHLTYARNGHGTRVRASHGNLIDTENEENLSFNDSYQPKIIDTKTRTAIPVHRYPSTHNHIQTSASTSSVNSTQSRTRLPIATSANLDRKDSNVSGSDLTRLSKRADDNRLLSPNGQRRPILVSVFAPAKSDNKPPASTSPSSTSPTNESNVPYNSESQPEQLPSFSSNGGDNSYTTIYHENEFNTKLSSSNSALKSTSGSLLNELSLTHDNSKKMNVFERLFRGHKKKV